MNHLRPTQAILYRILPTMSSATAPDVGQPALNRKEIQARVNQLRNVDNLHNWIDVIREVLIVTTVFFATVGCHYWRMNAGYSWLWDVPILLLGLFFMGLAQHRLSIVGHEGSHYALFQNRLLNEVVSNWSCMYGLMSTTHLYRLQHMAHHQYVNDPEKDPDLLYMSVIGAKYQHPYGRWRFIRNIAIPLFVSIPAQIKYILIRAKIASFGGGYGPYKAQRQQHKALTLIHTLYLASVIAMLAAGVYWANLTIATVAVIGLAVIMAIIESRIPEDWYMKAAIRPTIAPRWDLYQRLIFFSLIFVALAWLTYITRLPWPLYYLILWFVPLGTSFPFLMMVREEVQHTNAGQGRFTHTRNFLGNRLIRFAVFPMHMGYHLEHHLFPMVPHYNLPELSEFLKSNDENYRRTITIVDGYLLPRHSAKN